MKYSTKQIKKCLFFFIDEDSKRYPLEPVTQGDKVFATDGHAIIQIDKKMVRIPYYAHSRYDLHSVFPSYDDIDWTIVDVKKMKFILNTFHQLEDEMEEQSSTCAKCDGEGTIECDLGHDHDCDQCDGDGEMHVLMPTGKQIIDPHSVYYDGVNYFTYHQMSRVLDVVEVLGHDKFALKRIADKKPYLINSGPFMIAMMPVDVFDVNKFKIHQFEY